MLGIDGGIVNVGVCVLNEGAIEVLETDRIHSTQNKTVCELSTIVAMWVCDRAEKWGLRDVDLLVVESVIRAKIQSVGVAIVAAISTWRISNGLPLPKIMMKSGRTKFNMNPHMKAAAASLQGKRNYHDRKHLSVRFCHHVWPETSEQGPDSCDALLLALAGSSCIAKSKLDQGTLDVLKLCASSSMCPS